MVEPNDFLMYENKMLNKQKIQLFFQGTEDYSEGFIYHKSFPYLLTPPNGKKIIYKYEV